MNSARLKACLSYYDVRDSYSIPEILRKARSRFDLYGVPIALSPEPCKFPTPTPSQQDHGPGPSSSTQTSQKEFDEDDNFISAMSSCTGIFHMAFYRLFSPVRRLFSIGGGDTTVTNNEHRRTLALNREPLHLDASASSENIDIESNRFQQSHSQCSSNNSNIYLQTGNSFANGINAETETLASNRTYFDPYVKTYQIEPESGVKMDVLELELAYKKTVFENFLIERQDLNSLVLSEKCATLIWIWSEKTRIVLITESVESGTWSLKQWYSKILSDMALTDSILISHPYYWHPVVRRRLGRAIRHFKKLYECIDKQETVSRARSSSSITPAPIHFSCNNAFCTTSSKSWSLALAPSSTTSSSTVKLSFVNPDSESGDPGPGPDPDPDPVMSTKNEFEYINPDENMKVIVSSRPPKQYENISSPKNDSGNGNGNSHSNLTARLASDSELNSSSGNNIVNDMYLKWSDYSAKLINKPNSNVTNNFKNPNSNWPKNSKFTIRKQSVPSAGDTTDQFSSCDLTDFKTNTEAEPSSSSISTSGPREDLENFLTNLTDHIGIPPEDSISLSLGPQFKFDKLTRNISTVSSSALLPQHQVPVHHNHNHNNHSSHPERIINNQDDSQQPINQNHKQLHRSKQSRPVHSLRHCASPSISVSAHKPRHFKRQN